VVVVLDDLVEVGLALVDEWLAVDELTVAVGAGVVAVVAVGAL
jgi:hypothetical protein